MRSLSAQFIVLLRLELKNSLRAYPEILLPLGFFLIISTILALSMPVTLPTLKPLAAGAVWISTLLAILLSMDRLFVADYQSGHLAILHQAQLPMAFIMFVKIINHWLTTLIPLILISPLIGLFYHLSFWVYGVLMVSISVSSMALICLNTLGSALTVGLNHRGILLTLLMIPLQIPIILFGISAVSLYAHHQDAISMIALLGALSIFMLIVSPFLCALCLRVTRT